jgi:hypothetical protein
MYNYTNNLLPISLCNLWLTKEARRNIDFPLVNRALRADSLLNIPFIRTEQFCQVPAGGIS